MHYHLNYLSVEQNDACEIDFYSGPCIEYDLSNYMPFNDNDIDDFNHIEFEVECLVDGQACHASLWVSNFSDDENNDYLYLYQMSSSAPSWDEENFSFSWRIF